MFKELLSYVNSEKISIYKKLSEDFIREFIDKVYWERISGYQNLPYAPSFDSLKINSHGKAFHVVKLYQKISFESLTIKLDWEAISKNKYISEDFIREFKDKVDWEGISEYQNLIEDFILAV